MNAQRRVERSNPFTVVRISDPDNRGLDEFITYFSSLLDKPEDLIYIKVLYREENKNQTFLAAIKKYFNDKYVENEDFRKSCNLDIKRFTPLNKPIGFNMTWGFFIKTNEVMPESIISIFTKFENVGFLIKESYEIIFPRPYPDGKNRDYLIVVFNKIDNNFPRKFIRKLKILLDKSIVNGCTLRVNWLSNSVKNDIIQGENKELKNKSE